MEIFLVWVGFSIAVAVWAGKRGRSAGGWLVLALVLSPLLAAAFLALADDLSDEAQEKRYSHITHVRCPDCRELVRKDAIKCKHCGTSLAPEEA
jgi:hypothetical protein